MQAAYSYGASVVDQKSSIKIQAVSHGRLKLTWQADESGRIQLPIVTYRQSRLIVNGKKLTRFKRSLVGSPTVVQQPGQNTAYLSYAAPLCLNFLIAISLLSWLAWALRMVFNHQYSKSKHTLLTCLKNVHKNEVSRRFASCPIFLYLSDFIYRKSAETLDFMADKHSDPDS